MAKKSVKISFPYQGKRKFKFTKEQAYFVVLCKYGNGNWGIAHFFHKPFFSWRYDTARDFRRNIQRSAFKIQSYWTLDKFVVAKIEL